MTEQECLQKMIAPGTRRPGKYREGVIQIHVTRACDKACLNCTQGSELGGRLAFMSVDQFRDACRSLKGYFGVVGMFGGNPALHPKFPDLCAVMREEVPFEQRGLWCNNPLNEANARAMRETFNPAVSNLNVHLDAEAYSLFKTHWPESRPFGLNDDSRHAPVFVAMKDVVRKECPDCCDGLVEPPTTDAAGDFNYCPTCTGTGRVADDSHIYDLISTCDINQHWSAMIGVFRGQLRAWFCEIAGAQAMLHQDEEDYPDTGLDPTVDFSYLEPAYAETGRWLEWWQLPMISFAQQVRKHCFDCGVPLRGYGELSQAEPVIVKSPQHMSAAALEAGAVEEILHQPREQCSETHRGIFKSKRKGREIEIVTKLEQLGVGRLRKITDYMGNAKR